LDLAGSKSLSLDTLGVDIEFKPASMPSAFPCHADWPQGGVEDLEF